MLFTVKFCTIASKSHQVMVYVFFVSIYFPSVNDIWLYLHRYYQNYLISKDKCKFEGHVS